MNLILDKNRQAWNERARLRKRHTKTVLAIDLLNPLPILDPENWLEGNIVGREALCLASGGGLQSALMAAAGARTTVVDISPGMLELDRKIAHEHGLTVRAVESSMDDLSMFADEFFDIILQPVSSCYVPDILAVYREITRVLKTGGIYISQHKQPLNLQAAVAPGPGGYVVQEPYFRKGPLPPVIECDHREADSMEYLHRWEELLGGMCRNGFAIEALREPKHADPAAAPGSFGHRSCFVPPYIKVKARKISPSQGTRRLWAP